MATGTSPLHTLYPAGFPEALAVGRVVELKLFVPGNAVPQARPRGRVVTPANKKPWVQFYEEKPSSDWQDHVAEHVRYQSVKVPIQGDGGTFVLPFVDVRAFCTLTFNLHRPVSYPARITQHTKKPDVDNLAKGVLDGMVKGMLLKDDSCITDLTIRKRFADETENPLPGMAGPPLGVAIELTVLPTEVP